MPRTARKLLVTQSQLALLYRLQQRVRTLQSEVEYAEQACRGCEQEVLGLLDEGAMVESGPMLAAVQTTSRRSVKWRGLFEWLFGKSWAENILAATTPTLHRHVVVNRRGRE